MEIVIIEKTAFEMLLAGVKALEDRVRTLAEKGGERYLTDRDLAERLHVSRRTLQQYRHEGILPYFLFGGKTLYRESDVQKVLERNYRKAY